MQTKDKKICEFHCGKGEGLEKILLEKLKELEGESKEKYIEGVLALYDEIYGEDGKIDCIIVCRERLFCLAKEKVTKFCGKEKFEEIEEKIKQLLKKNIVYGKKIYMIK